MLDIVGHKNIVSFLEKSIKNDSVSHAYLFYGPKKLGKRTLARNFSRTLLGQDLDKHPDFHYIKRGYNKKGDKLTKNISIEQIRELEQRLSLSSFLNSYKIGIIREAELLSIEASNSLLKTLEEPTEKTVLILLATNINALPLTVVSRCQVLKFSAVSYDEIYDHLVSGMGAKRDEARNLASISWGRPGAAIDYWTSRNNEKNSPFLDYQNSIEGIIEIMQGNTFVERMGFFENVFKEKKDSQELIISLNKIFAIWLSVLRDMALLKHSCNDLVFNYSFESNLERLAHNFDNKIFFNLSREIRKANSYLANNFNPKLVVENLMLLF